MKNTVYGLTPLGLIGISEIGGSITDLFIVKDKRPENFAGYETPVLKEAKKQLMEYFAGFRKQFYLPLAPEGTEFQKTVWAVLCKIPYGETRSYKQVAAAIGRPNAYRAVGMANRNNPVMIITPCHRVIGSNGKLVGFAAGLDIKEKLLNFEKRHANI